MIIKYNQEEKGEWKKERTSLKEAKIYLNALTKVKSNEKIRVTFNPYNKKVARVSIFNKKRGRSVKWIEKLTDRTEEELKNFVRNNKKLELKIGRYW